MNLLITGASGFVGRYVIMEAARRGHRVVATSRSEPELHSPDVGSIRWHRCDLAVPESLRLKHGDIDAVVHLAASLSGDYSQRFRTTIESTRNLLCAMRRAGISRLIGISSIAVLDFASAPALSLIDEDVATAPASEELSIYAAMKLEQENLFDEFSRTELGCCAILRPGVVYDSDRLISARAGIIEGPIRLLAMHGGEVPTVEASGLARAILNACERKIEGTIHLVDDNLPSQRAYLDGLRRRGILGPSGVPIHWYVLSTMASAVRLSNRLIGSPKRTPDVLLKHSIASRIKPFRYANEKAKRLLAWMPADSFY